MSTFLPAVPYFPNLPSYTQDDFLALFDRLLPQYYLEPMKSPGPGYEYLQAVAKVMERVSQSVAHMGDAAYIGTATGGARARATVEISRDNHVFGQVVLIPGTVVGTLEGFLYQTLTTVSFGALEIGSKRVEVEATARGWDWNKPGEAVSATGEVLPGSINKLVAAVVPEGGTFDPTLTVRQVSPGVFGVYAPYVQPAVGATVTAKLYVYPPYPVPVLPQVGQTLLLGSAINKQDVYLVESVTVTASIDCRLRLLSASNNAPGTTIALYTMLHASSDAYGGVSPSLDGLGIDRGIYRQGNNAVVKFTLPAPATSRVILLPGSRLATAGAYVYQTLESVTFEQGQTEGTAQAAPVVRPDSYASYGEIQNLTLPRWGTSEQPDYSDITVAQITPFSRESDESYRTRVALLPLVVTPNNVELLLNQTIGSVTRAAGKTYAWREVWDIRFQSAYSATSWPSTTADDFPINTTLNYAELNVEVDPYNSNIFVYDYEPDDPLSNRYLGQVGMIVFALPEIAGQELAYAGLAELLDGATAAGIPLGYILTP